MSITTEEFAKHLSNENNNIILLYGNWGIGKSYFWKQNNHSFCPESLKPIYTSVFGLKSLDEIKRELSSNRPSKAPKINTSIVSKILAPFSKAKGVNTDPKSIEAVLSWLQFSFVKDALICLDDIERKHPSLNLIEILGLITFLVEQRGCKVIIILNEDKLSEKEVLDTFRERTIDLEIGFKRTFEENFGVVFNENHLDYDYIYSLLSRLDLRNIRILKKIDRNLNNLHPHYERLESSTRHEIIKHIILISWSYYNTESSIPIEFLMNFSEDRRYNFLKLESKSGIDKVMDAPPTESEQVQIDQARQLGELEYIFAEYDRCLLDFIKSASTNMSVLSNSWIELNKREITHQISQKLRNVWSIYNTNFDKTEAEFVSAAINFLDNNIKELSLYEYSQIRGMLLRLGNDVKKYDNLITTDLSLTTDKLNELTQSYGRRIDIDFIKFLEEKAVPSELGFSIASILKTSRKEKGWSGGAIPYLASKTADDYYEWIINSKDEGLTYDIREALSYENIQGDPSFQKIASNVKQALRRIAKINNFNKIRVELIFGIDLSGSQDEPS